MVVKEDGTKWACQSCLKGHRVSGCTHTDRELILVPKKGRPVTQCQHCRLERKKRSAHVRCECGEADKPHHPKEKCIHLREAEERAKAGHLDEHHADLDLACLAAVAEEQGCCCHHGGKCSCAILKKEPDASTSLPHGPAVKPRLEKTSSDGAITVFTNGHHKPVHRKNLAAHECGMPYKMPMPRSVTESTVASASRRSVDAQASERTLSRCSSHTSSTPLPAKGERQASRSGQHSPSHPTPGSIACTNSGDTHFGSIDFTDLAQIQTNSSIQSYMSETFASPLDAIAGTNDSAFDPWSNFPSADSSVMPNNNPFGVWPTQHDNTSISQPTLTSASSTTQSEVDELPSIDDYGYHMPSIQEDSNSDTVNAATESSPQTNRRSLPPGFFGNAEFGTTVFNNEWEAPVDNAFQPTGQDKMQQNVLSTSYDDSYQMPTFPPFMSVPQRALGGMAQASRPQSRSVGSTSAPNDDIIRQLFPDLDLNNGLFGAAASPQMAPDTMMNGISKNDANSTQFDYGPMDEEVSFTAHQPWADGTIAVPVDPYTDSYDLDQDFANPDFSGNWSQ